MRGSSIQREGDDDAKVEGIISDYESEAEMSEETVKLEKNCCEEKLKTDFLLTVALVNSLSVLK